jgi:hypothetical protein
MKTYIRTEDAANYVGRSQSNLEKLRMTERGPLFIKRGGIVIYDVDDLDSWLAGGKRLHTDGKSGVQV